MAGYAIRGALKWTAENKVLLGEDASLGRRVLIWLRPTTETALDVARRDIGRRTRLRWLATGKQGDLQWDALLAPSGCPLPEYLHSEGTLEWSEARMLLEDLANELDAALAEKTLPATLAPSQVWVQSDGRAQLADFALTLDESEDSRPTTGTDQERALALVQHVALLALEGKSPNLAGPATLANPTIPATARSVLERLLGRHYASVEEFQRDLTMNKE
jgi:hypothetical protein